MREIKSVKQAKNVLYELSHTYIRKRDSDDKDFIGGKCFDCGYFATGGNFQAGHFIPDSKGFITRYHPLNMHGQFSGCNMKYQQERVKINYTMAMIKKYGKPFVDKLIQLSNKTVRTDLSMFLKLIELYKEGNEKKIIQYLESLV